MSSCSEFLTHTPPPFNQNDSLYLNLVCTLGLHIEFV